MKKKNSPRADAASRRKRTMAKPKAQITPRFAVPEAVPILAKPSTAKHRVTFYVDLEVNDALGVGLVEARKIARAAGIRRVDQVNKSWLAEAALLIALRDLAEKGPESGLAALIHGLAESDT